MVDGASLIHPTALNEQILLVVHTFRYDDVIRIISARKATQNEKATYTRRAK